MNKTGKTFKIKTSNLNYLAPKAYTISA